MWGLTDLDTPAFGSGAVKHTVWCSVAKFAKPYIPVQSCPQQSRWWLWAQLGEPPCLSLGPILLPTFPELTYLPHLVISFVLFWAEFSMDYHPYNSLSYFCFLKMFWDSVTRVYLYLKAQWALSVCCLALA